MSPEGAGKLILVSSPIGNLGDLSPRASAALAEAEIWLVEDTRVSGRLQQHLGVKRRMIVLNEQTRAEKLRLIAGDLLRGQVLALLTDAGVPSISDPGALLVDICQEQSIPVDCIPGPSAVTTALALSGFYAQRFVFLGFLPRKASAMAEILSPYKESTMTLVFFESPHRFDDLLTACALSLGDRRYAICREMTKLHEQVWRSRLPALPTPTEVPHKGEFTIVVEGVRKHHASTED